MMQTGGRDIFRARSIKLVPKIGEKHVNLLAVEHVCRASDIRGDIHIVIVLEQTAQPVAGMLLIIHNKDGRLKVH